jgi:Skp family chaperone for outer membrane proteins
MRYTVACALLVMSVLVAAPASAGKIGFVDAERAVAEVDEGRAKISELDEWAKPRRDRLDQLRARIAELRQEIAQKQAIASQEAMQSLQQDELQTRRDFEDSRRDFERELDQKQNEFLADVAVKVGTVASEYGQANDYDAIFVLKAQPLIYVRESADLTETVIRLYNERFPR